MVVVCFYSIVDFIVDIIVFVIVIVSLPSTFLLFFVVNAINLVKIFGCFQFPVTFTYVFLCYSD